MIVIICSLNNICVYICIYVYSHIVFVVMIISITFMGDNIRERLKNKRRKGHGRRPREQYLKNNDVRTTDIM